MKDDLEKFFFKKLKQDTPGEESWNIPSENAWSSLRKSRDKKKDNKYYFLLWFVLLASTFSIGYSYYSLHLIKEEIAIISKTQDIITDKKDIHSDQPKNLQTNSIIESSIEKKETSFIDNDHVSDSEVNSIKTTLSQTPLSSQIKNSQQSSEHKLSENSINKRINKDINKIDNQVHNQGRSIENKKKSSHISSKTTIKPLALNQDIPFLANTKTTPLSIEKVQPQFKVVLNTPDNIEESQNWKIGFYFGPAFSAIPISEISDNSDEMTGSDRIQLTYSTGVEIGFELANNLYITGGLLCQGVKYNMNSSKITSYDKSTEFINSEGEMENIQNINIPSAIGDLTSKVHMSHSSTIDINDNTPFEYKVDIEQHLHLISIPIGIEHQLEIGKNIYFNSGIGISLNHLLKNDLNLKPTIIMDGKNMDFESTNIIDVNLPNHLNYYLESGISYSIKNSAQIFFKANYFRNFSSIYSTNENENNLSSRIHGLNLKLGFSKKL